MIETGLYVRAQRGGKWESLDLGEMTESELRAWLDSMPPTEHRKWVLGLVEWIQTNVVAEPGG